MAGSGTVVSSPSSLVLTRHQRLCQGNQPSGRTKVTSLSQIGKGESEEALLRSSSGLILHRGLPRTANQAAEKVIIAAEKEPQGLKSLCEYLQSTGEIGDKQVCRDF